jgi:hypothetical protein
MLTFDPDPILLRKSGSPGYRTGNLWICSQELWPLDHRGGRFLPQLYKILFSLLTLLKVAEIS